MPRGGTRSGLPKHCKVQVNRIPLKRDTFQIKDTKGVLTLKAENFGYTIQDHILIPRKIITRSGKSHLTYIRRGMNTLPNSTETATKPLRRQFAKKSTGGANEALKHLFNKRQEQGLSPATPPTKKQKAEETKSIKEDNTIDDVNDSIGKSCDTNSIETTANKTNEHVTAKLPIVISDDTGTNKNVKSSEVLTTKKPLVRKLSNSSSKEAISECRKALVDQNRNVEKNTSKTNSSQENPLKTLLKKLDPSPIKLETVNGKVKNGKPLQSKSLNSDEVIKHLDVVDCKDNNTTNKMTRDHRDRQLLGTKTDERTKRLSGSKVVDNAEKPDTKDDICILKEETENKEEVLQMQDKDNGESKEVEQKKAPKKNGISLNSTKREQNTISDSDTNSESPLDKLIKEKESYDKHEEKPRAVTPSFDRSKQLRQKTTVLSKKRHRSASPGYKDAKVKKSQDVDERSSPKDPLVKPKFKPEKLKSVMKNVMSQRKDQQTSRDHKTVHSENKQGLSTKIHTKKEEKIAYLMKGFKMAAKVSPDHKTNDSVNEKHSNQRTINLDRGRSKLARKVLDKKKQDSESQGNLSSDVQTALDIEMVSDEELEFDSDNQGKIDLTDDNEDCNLTERAGSKKEEQSLELPEKVDSLKTDDKTLEPASNGKGEEKSCNHEEEKRSTVSEKTSSQESFVLIDEVHSEESNPSISCSPTKDSPKKNSTSNVAKSSPEDSATVIVISESSPEQKSIKNESAMTERETSKVSKDTEEQVIQIIDGDEEDQACENLSTLQKEPEVITILQNETVSNESSKQTTSSAVAKVIMHDVQTQSDSWEVKHRETQTMCYKPKTQNTEIQTTSTGAAISLEEVNRIVKAIMESEFHEKETLKKALQDTIQQLNDAKANAEDLKTQLQIANAKLCSREVKESKDAVTNTESEENIPMFPLIIQSRACQTEKVTYQEPKVIDSIDLTTSTTKGVTSSPTSATEKGKALSSLLNQNREHFKTTVQNACHSNQSSSVQKTVYRTSSVTASPQQTVATVTKPSTIVRQNSMPSVTKPATPTRIGPQQIHTGHSGTPPAKRTTVTPSTPSKAANNDDDIIDLTAVEEPNKQREANSQSNNVQNQIIRRQNQPSPAKQIPQTSRPVTQNPQVQIRQTVQQNQQLTQQRQPQRFTGTATSTSLSSSASNVTSHRVNAPQTVRQVPTGSIQNHGMQQQQVPVSQQILVSRSLTQNQPIMLNSSQQQQFIHQPSGLITQQQMGQHILQQMQKNTQEQQKIAMLIQQQQQQQKNVVRGPLTNISIPANLPRASAAAAAALNQARQMTQPINTQQRLPSPNTGVQKYTFHNITQSTGTNNVNSPGTGNSSVLNVPSIQRRIGTEQALPQSLQQTRSKAELLKRNVTTLNLKLLNLQQREKQILQHLQLAYACKNAQEVQNFSRTRETLMKEITTVQAQLVDAKTALAQLTSANPSLIAVQNHIPEGNRIQTSMQQSKPSQQDVIQVSSQRNIPPNRTIPPPQYPEQPSFATQRTTASGKVWMPPKSPNNQMSQGSPSVVIPHQATHPAPLPSLPGSRQPAGTNLPPQPSIRITHNSEGVVLSWNINPTGDNSTVKKYLLYAYQVLNSPPSTSHWKKIGDVEALAPPMACTLNQFQPGSTYHLAICAVDVYGRIGRFSQTEEVHIPLERA